MGLEWIRDNPPHWDERKNAVVGGAPAGAFDLPTYGDGDLLPGDWWRVEREGQTIGFGWLDVIWGEAEVLLAVHPEHQRTGVGTFILDNLEREAAERGLNYIYNVVRPSHPEAATVTRWLESRRFAESGDGQLKRRVEHRD